MNPYITPDLYQFLSDLSANNNRDWFNAHKDRYEQVYKKAVEEVEGPSFGAP